MTLTDIENILKQLSPQEVIDACGLDEDVLLLVESLSDYIEDQQESIYNNLVESGMITEGEDN